MASFPTVLTTSSIQMEANISATTDIITLGLNSTTMSSDSNTFQICGTVDNCLWTIFAPMVFFVGIFGNILNVYVLCRLKFYENATLCLLFALAFVDMTVLCVGPTRYWIKSTFDVDIRDISGFSCKFHLFLIYVSMQMSSWILVQVTCVRFVKTVLLDNRFTGIRKLVTIKNSMITFVMISVCIMALDFHYFFTNGIITDETGCDSLSDEILHFEEFVFVYIDLMVLVVIPGIIMFVLNIFIIKRIRKMRCNKRLSTGSDSSQRMSRKGQQNISKMTKMLVFTTFYFVAASLPICIYFIVDSYVRPDATPDVEQSLDLAWVIVYLIQFTHFASNFYFYTATNKRFRDELRKIARGVSKLFSPVATSDPSTTGESHLRSATGDT